MGGLLVPLVVARIGANGAGSALNVVHGSLGAIELVGMRLFGCGA